MFSAELFHILNMLLERPGVIPYQDYFHFYIHFTANTTQNNTHIHQKERTQTHKIVTESQSGMNRSHW